MYNSTPDSTPVDCITTQDVFLVSSPYSFHLCLIAPYGSESTSCIVTTRIMIWSTKNTGLIFQVTVCSGFYQNSNPNLKACYCKVMQNKILKCRLEQQPSVHKGRNNVMAGGWYFFYIKRVKMSNQHWYACIFSENFERRKNISDTNLHSDGSLDITGQVQQLVHIDLQLGHFIFLQSEIEQECLGSLDKTIQQK